MEEGLGLFWANLPYGTGLGRGKGAERGGMCWFIPYHPFEGAVDI